MKKIWDEIDDKILDLLVDDFFRRCEMVRDLGGQSASQYISSHKKEVENKVDAGNKRMWTNEEYDQLIALQHSLGNKWGQIGKYFGRDSTQVKNRFRFLMVRKNNDRLKSIVDLPPIESLPFDPGPIFGNNNLPEGFIWWASF